MGCGMGMIKYLLFIFNFLFVLCGLAILVIGVIVHLKIDDYKDIVEEHITFPSLMLIIVGSIIFVIAFFGCCGAIRESHCMMITFASFLLIILIIQIAVAIYAFVVLRNSDISVKDGYANEFKKYYSNNATRDEIDAIQSALECCGVDSSNDFRQMGDRTIPGSCCGKPQTQICSTSAEDKIYNIGCVEQIKKLFKYSGTVLGGIALGIAGIELVGIIFSLCLANSIRNTERRGYRV